MLVLASTSGNRYYNIIQMYRYGSLNGVLVNQFSNKLHIISAEFKKISIYKLQQCIYTADNKFLLFITCNRHIDTIAFHQNVKEETWKFMEFCKLVLLCTYSYVSFFPDSIVIVTVFVLINVAMDTKTSSKTTMAAFFLLRLW